MNALHIDEENEEDWLYHFSLQYFLRLSMSPWILWKKSEATEKLPTRTGCVIFCISLQQMDAKNLNDYVGKPYSSERGSLSRYANLKCAYLF